MKHTPLYDEHVAAGARLVEFAGWEMPVQYASIVQEHRAVRTAAGLFDVSHMGEVELAGVGAEETCRRLFSNDAGRLSTGRAHYSLIVNDQGGIVDDVIVYRLAADRFFVCVNASNVDKDLDWIASHATTDCRVTDRSAQTALIALQGPRAAAILERAGPELGDLPRFGFCSARIGESTALIARTGYTGEDGFEAFVPAIDAVGVWRRLLEAGTDIGLVPAGLGARDTLRLEAALPLYGHELGEKTSPYEVGLGWVVKLNRRELVGYQALAAAREGAVRRRLIGLEISGGIARQGCPIVACGARIGEVTSGSYCPTVAKALALGLVDRDAALENLGVEIREKVRPANVTTLPFYVTGTRA